MSTATAPPEVNGEAQHETDNIAANVDVNSALRAAGIDPAEIDHLKSDQLRLRDAEQLAKEASAAEWEWEDAKTKASECKKEFDKANDRLRAFLRAGINDADRPLLREAEKPKELWRTAGLEQLELTDHQLEKFKESNVETIGQLEDLRAGAGLTTVDGIGEGRASEITERLLCWLVANRETWGAEVPAADDRVFHGADGIMRNVSEVIADSREKLAAAEGSDDGDELVDVRPKRKKK